MRLEKKASLHDSHLGTKLKTTLLMPRLEKSTDHLPWTDTILSKVENSSVAETESLHA